ncbi:FAD/NAD(P)-binding domain-containing protein [Massarina eburnea CBS 473.64]|uniref:FAD/NAD(P)-binding domain-containing protein n=1 Tax=Massarina eburnea CBS 473.64 TaxID=1395130 RepID=A0A6A6S2N7_9PLEO|nr:FAD/NAD(P)-binding domain-containing protein [Massarina eburnea CBS 473.64]
MIKIAIIGAGPGGCMLARLLQQNNIASTVFEAEASINYRSQGGTLDLRTKTGLQAIKEADLWDEFQKHARYDGESLLLCDKNLQIWLQRDGRKPDEKQKMVQEAPEIDRSVLRKMLMESLPDGCVKWGYKLKKVDDDLSLVFENGQVEKGFDLVVGADGAWSKTRKFLSEEIPRYSGIGRYGMSIHDPEDTAPEIYKLVNRGSVFAFGDKRSLNCQQMGDGSLTVAYYGHYPEDFSNTCGFDISDVSAMKEFLREEVHDWSPKLKAIFEHAGSPIMWSNIYMLPVGFRWTHKKGVTLIGDAAHVMAPFAGIGVNNALNDALLLSRQIVAHAKDGKIDDLDNRIEVYEMEMFEVTKAAGELTEGSMNDMFFTEGAPRTNIASYCARHANAEFPAWSHPIISTIIHTKYFVMKMFY